MAAATDISLGPNHFSRIAPHPAQIFNFRQRFTWHRALAPKPGNGWNGRTVQLFHAAAMYFGVASLFWGSQLNYREAVTCSRGWHLYRSVRSATALEALRLLVQVTATLPARLESAPCLVALVASSSNQSERRHQVGRQQNRFTFDPQSIRSLRPVSGKLLPRQFGKIRPLQSASTSKLWALAIAESRPHSLSKNAAAVRPRAAPARPDAAWKHPQR